MDWLRELPREWVFPDLGELRPRPGPRRATYYWWPLGDLPSVEIGARSAIDLLVSHPGHPNGISDDEAAEPMDRVRLEAMLGTDRASTIPDSLRSFVADPEPRRRIRSVTGCFLDLGEAVVPIEGGGSLLHLVSDQQWVVHWLVVLSGSPARNPSPVIASSVPYGYPVAGDAPGSFDRKAALDQTADRTVVCADSVDEFLARFFLENEAWLAAHGGIAGAPTLSSDVQSYIAALRSARTIG